MANTIMLGAWGLGRKTLVSEAPALGLDMQGFIQKVGIGFTWKIMSSIERELESSARHPSFTVSPLSRKSMGNLDITPFILYDNVVMDSTSYAWLVNEGGKLPLTQAWATEESISILEGLREKGILILKDYSEILEKPQQATILRAMMYLDINDPWMTQAWLASIQTWIEFLESGIGTSEENDQYLENIISQLQIILDRASRGVAGSPGDSWYWMYLADCLSDVNCALLVSRVLDMPFLDWNDYRPFYQYKFFRALRQLDKQKDLESLRKLFDVFVPRLNVRHVEEILALREDRRFKAVRELARTTRPEDINDDLVRQAISDVLRMKDKAQGFSKVVSLVTIPIGFIPIWGDPLQILVQEVAEQIYRKYLEKEYIWQCFFVDLYTKYTPSVLEDRLQCVRPM